MNDRVITVSEGENTWDARAKVGTSRINRVWERLRPQTKDLLIKDGFDAWGSRDIPLGIGDDTGDLAYSLGVFVEAVKEKLPMHYGDTIASCYMADEVLNEAANLLYSRDYCDPAFTSLALHACINHQTANAASSRYFHGGKRAGTKSGLALSGTVIAVLVFSAVLATSIGNGLVSALEHDAITSSVLAFVAMFSFGTLKSLNKPNEESKWEVASTLWSSLIYRDFHIGTGHGVEHQLHQLVSKGVHVPSVLFDLCAVLQQGMQYQGNKDTNPA